MPFPADPCPTCPRLARGLPMPCRAMTSGHARFCTLAASGHAGYIALLVGESPPPPPQPTPTIPLAESLRVIGLARACPDRTAPQCGCAAMATCLRGKGKAGQVSLSECVACVSAP